jgi:hypothetical protein
MTSDWEERKKNGDELFSLSVFLLSAALADVKQTGEHGLPNHPESKLLDRVENRRAKHVQLHRRPSSAKIESLHNSKTYK